MKKNYTVQVQANEKVITNEEQNKLRVQEDNRITLVSDLHKKKQDNSNLEEINKVKQEQTAEKLKEIDKKTVENEAESVKKESEEKIKVFHVILHFGEVYSMFFYQTIYYKTHK